MKPHILLVEDEEHIARGLVFNLESEDYRVTHAESGEEALDVFRKDQFSLVILDLMLPGMDGFEVCRRMRHKDQRLPILILTARGEEQDRVQGLSVGADDYLSKPFSLEEFLLRVRGILRRSQWYRPQESAQEEFPFGENRVNLQERKAQTPHGEIELTELEVKMLEIFLQQPGRTLTRSELLSAVWGVSPGTETRTVDNFIVRLRRYFEPDPALPVHFITVRGRGYRFEPHDQE